MEHVPVYKYASGGEMFLCLTMQDVKFFKIIKFNRHGRQFLARFFINEIFSSHLTGILNACRIKVPVLGVMQVFSWCIQQIVEAPRTVCIRELQLATLRIICA